MMFTPTPEVTLVIACYNHADYVDLCLESVARQTRPPRLIVIDDASSDESRSRISAALARLDLEATMLFHPNNMGVCAAFNHGLEHVTTEWVAFLAADDAMFPHRIERQLEAISTAGPATAVVHSDMITMDVHGKSQELWSQTWPPAALLSSQSVSFEDLLRSNPISAPSALIRARSIRDVGGYDSMLPFEDLDMWLRLARAGYAFHYIPEPLVLYRVHASSMSTSMDASLDPGVAQAYIRIYAKHLHVSSRTDAIIVPLLFDFACKLYKMGINDSSIRSHLWRYTIRKRSLRGLVHWSRASLAAATRRLPDTLRGRRAE